MATGQQMVRAGILTLALVGLRPCGARADLITGTTGLNGLGDFEGTLDYSATDSGHATLTVVLTNTSPAGNGGYLTAFAFNNPGQQITGVTLPAGAFAVLGGSAGFSGGVTGSPYGQFDIGASTGGSWEGGGNPSAGLGVGQTGTFVFSLTGTGLDSLSAASFLGTLSAGPGDGEGDAAFVARFRGFNDGGSDKVAGIADDSTVTIASIGTPEPGALTLCGMALLSLAGCLLPRVRHRLNPAA